jgi:hypothetical protein
VKKGNLLLQAMTEREKTSNSKNNVVGGPKF